MCSDLRQSVDPCNLRQSLQFGNFGSEFASSPIMSVFIGKLASHVTQEQLLEVFQGRGPIADVHLLPKGGLYGAAFVKFEHWSTAASVVAHRSDAEHILGDGLHAAWRTLPYRSASMKTRNACVANLALSTNNRSPHPESVAERRLAMSTRVGIRQCLELDLQLRARARFLEMIAEGTMPSTGRARARCLEMMSMAFSLWHMGVLARQRAWRVGEELELELQLELRDVRCRLSRSRRLEQEMCPNTPPVTLVQRFD